MHRVKILGDDATLCVGITDANPKARDDPIGSSAFARSPVRINPSREKKALASASTWPATVKCGFASPRCAQAAVMRSRPRLRPRDSAALGANIAGGLFVFVGKADEIAEQLMRASRQQIKGRANPVHMTIRSQETGRRAVDLAQSGRVVLAAMHGASIQRAFGRWHDLGLSLEMLQPVLRGIMHAMIIEGEKATFLVSQCRIWRAEERLEDWDGRPSGMTIHEDIAALIRSGAVSAAQVDDVIAPEPEFPLCGYGNLREYLARMR